jgi:hypothetical protein
MARTAPQDRAWFARFGFNCVNHGLVPTNPIFSRLTSNPTCSARTPPRLNTGPTPTRYAMNSTRFSPKPGAAQKLPWEPKTVLLYRTIFPQMTNWLPEEEGAQLRFEFEAEIKRLEAA